MRLQSMTYPNPDMNKIILLIHELAAQNIISKKDARRIYHSANGRMTGNLEEETQYIWDRLYDGDKLE